MFDYNLFRENLKKYRMQANLTQEELEVLSDVSYKNIGNLERGDRNPSLKTIIKFLNSFKMNVTSFMSGKDLDNKKLIITEINYTLSKLSSKERKNILELSKIMDVCDETNIEDVR